MSTITQMPFITREYILVRGDRFTPRLIYQHRETKAEVEAPNIHYNQPLSWRVDALRFYAEQSLRCAEYHAARKDRYQEMDARKRAANLFAHAEELAIMAVASET